ncbi:MAG: type II toxin-antitoxin system VapC family toxin [Candidatus Binatia bacterium]
MTWVVDASVAVKWVVPESLSEHADRLLGSEDPLMAPDLLMIEAANALWKKARRAELSAAEAARALDVLTSSGIVVCQAQPLLGRALAMAQRLDHPVYDCVYLALAERERATLVTADERLLGRLARRRLRARVVDLRRF